MVVENVVEHRHAPDAVSPSRKTAGFVRVLRTELPVSDLRAMCRQEDLLKHLAEIVGAFPSLDVPANEIFKIVAEQAVKLTGAGQSLILYYDGVPKTWHIAGESQNSPHTLDRAIINKLAQELTQVRTKSAQSHACIEQLIKDAKPYGVLLLPVIAEGTIVGVVCLVKDQSGTDFNVTDFSVCITCEKICSSMLGRSIFAKEMARQRARGEKLLVELNRAQSAERQRIGYELHDGIAQWLVGAAIELDSCRIRLDKGQLKELVDSLNSAQQTLRLCIQELRRSISNLRPVLITELGLLGAINQMARSFETDIFKCTVTVKDALPDFSDAEVTTIYWIIQEALNNVRKHASATSAEIRFARGTSAFEIAVLDDGKGFEAKDKNTSVLLLNKFGLEGMKERAKVFGWDFLVTSTPGVGTRVTLRLLNHGTAAQKEG
jgi:signal transduction histidine kinase